MKKKDDFKVVSHGRRSLARLMVTPTVSMKERKRSRKRGTSSRWCPKTDITGSPAIAPTMHRMLLSCNGRGSLHNNGALKKQNISYKWSFLALKKHAPSEQKKWSLIRNLHQFVVDSNFISSLKKKREKICNTTIWPICYDRIETKKLSYVHVLLPWSWCDVKQSK